MNHRSAPISLLMAKGSDQRPRGNVAIPAQFGSSRRKMLASATIELHPYTHKRLLCVRFLCVWGTMISRARWLMSLQMHAKKRSLARFCARKSCQHQPSTELLFTSRNISRARCWVFDKNSRVRGHSLLSQRDTPFNTALVLSLSAACVIIRQHLNWATIN